MKSIESFFYKRNQLLCLFDAPPRILGVNVAVGGLTFFKALPTHPVAEAQPLSGHASWQPLNRNVSGLF
jgi:hypothetical protein